MIKGKDNKMKKVTIFIGSARKGGTYKAAKQFEEELNKHCDVNVEYVFLSKGIEPCKGCASCFDRGEETCPIKDERDRLAMLMAESDGVVFATPNYAFQVSGLMKNFIDRMAYTFHRLKYFGKAFTSIVAQGIMGGGAIVKYLSKTGAQMGFSTSKGCVVRTIEPTPQKDLEKNKKNIAALAARYAKVLKRNELPRPSLYRLVMFRLTRTGIKEFGHEMKDFSHFEERGWFESDYYYKIKLGPIQKALGALSDVLGRKMAQAPK